MMNPAIRRLRSTKSAADTPRPARGSLPSTIDPMADVRALADALQLSRVPQVMECFDISNISTTHVVASMVCFRDGVPDKDNYRRYRVRTVDGQDDFASMAEVVRRRYSRVLLEAHHANSDVAEFSQENAADAMARISRHSDPTPAPGDSEVGRTIPLQESQVILRDPSTQKAFGARTDESFVAVRLPDLIIVDGGKGQLSAACRELQRLGLHDLPIIGLAKEREEIYRPGRALPLQLPMDSGALRLLQRIRDEAHRFAISGHRKRRARRHNESVLEAIPGLGPAKRRALLRHFGGMQGLLRAGVGDLEAVSGIGTTLARTLYDHLHPGA
jgi:excinuclease ABC subunit C